MRKGVMLREGSRGARRDVGGMGDVGGGVMWKC